MHNQLNNNFVSVEIGEELTVEMEEMLSVIMSMLVPSVKEWNGWKVEVVPAK